MKKLTTELEEHIDISRLTLPNGIKKLSYKELDILAQDIRDIIIENVSKTGGHLAPSLGVVELTIALLKIANLPKDNIIWDVGHQSYAYKILTGRLDRLNTLRQYKGISGFCNPKESKYDICISGHTSTSISAALGVQIGSELANRNHKGKTFAVIGDGAMGGGMSFEALNNLGMLQKNVIILLNDNEMSIDKNVGAIASYLSRTITGEFFTRIKKDIENIVEDAPLGDKFLSFAKKLETSVIGFLTPGSIFEEMGVKYIGPINGHKIKDIEKAINSAIIQDKPAIIHLVTVKGKGYPPAEKKPDIFHGVSPFNIATGEVLNKSTKRSWSDIFGDTLYKLAAKDKRIVAITAAMKEGTGLTAFAKKYPKRFFDVGIAEQHAVTFSAGLATVGMKPFFAVYSTFLQRAYDQIIHDVAITSLPVTFCIDRAGIVGADGPTHHGVFDLTFLKAIPNLTIMLPKNEFELIQMMILSLTINAPVAIRYPRGAINNYPELNDNPVKLGEAEIIKKGKDIVIITLGHIFDEGYKLYNILHKEKHSITLINIRFMKPLNVKPILQELKNKRLIITIEENALSGGMGEFIGTLLVENNIHTPLKKFGINDNFVPHGDIKNLRADFILDAESIYKSIKPLL